MDDAQAKVRQYIGGCLRAKGDTGCFTDVDSLVISGRLDSLDVVTVVAFLEDEFGVDFSDTGINQHAIDSVEAIAAFIEQD